MAGLIRPEDVQAVKERSSIEDVVREHVTLRPGGTGSLKGLCPFHDEKTPSFTVRPAVGAYHCFGCGEGGDVISFVMKVDHLTFAESVERLAGKIGMELRYDESTGGRGRRDSEGGLGRRARLVEGHRAAAEFYASAYAESPEGQQAREFMDAKGFTLDDAAVFQVGYAPQSGEALTRHLRAKGFTDDELVIGGLSGRGSRGLYDRFRGRVIWPIRDITGDTIGFGARRIYDDDRIAAKYLNTSETPIYKKTSVLYGLDLAKKPMAEQRRAVVVEGYTDVMACHLSGVDTAVATCGTAFGIDHIKMLRRILRDEPGLSPARVVFTFDGDVAGQKAAMRAFGEDQRWASQSYVAVAPAGQDPNDLRLRGGDEPVRELVDAAVPMFEFAVRSTIAPYDLDRAEERVSAMRAAAPILAGIRDKALRPEYVRTAAGWLGMPVERVAAEVARAGRAPSGRPGQFAERRAAPTAGQNGRPSGPGGQGPGPDQSGEAAQAPVLPRPDLRDPLVAAERQLLQVTLQYPGSLDDDALSSLPPDALRAPAHQVVLEGVKDGGGLATARTLSTQGWAAAVAEATRPEAQPLVNELSVAPLPVTLEPGSALPPRRYVDSLLSRVVEAGLARRIADAMSALQRAEPGSTQERAISEQLTVLYRERARLRAETE
ncbi:DNA primase [Ornithinimicrobium cryptoxanthini]|uniref:DNA primase n=1 Tax=Ornithinimicrobium cryptoxanthini TaxID=2934161 RepID=A0ABY4YEW4_9MICO|nr:DNA primase [Ornithinimicrobium cryptoxanthini]USQ75066.1 DNA primase [Ornithinimicrobium cryptoxanthini]